LAHSTNGRCSLSFQKLFKQTNTKIAFDGRKQRPQNASAVGALAETIREQHVWFHSGAYRFVID